jgi:hypothetical protein
MPQLGDSIVTPDVLSEICNRIQSGRTLRDVGRDPDLPSYAAVYYAMNRSEDVANAIARARRESAHALADSVVEVADEAADLDGISSARAQAIRNKCDQRRWLAGKLHSQYADKGQDVNVNVNLATLIEASRGSVADVPSASLEPPKPQKP